VLQQLAEERGEQPLHVLLDASQECLLVEVSGLETGYQYPSHLVKVGRVKHIRVAFGDEKYGHLEPSLMARSKDEAGVVPADHDGTKVRPVVDGLARLVGADGDSRESELLFDDVGDGSVLLADHENPEVALNRNLHCSCPFLSSDFPRKVFRPEPNSRRAGRPRLDQPAGSGSATTCPLLPRRERWPKTGGMAPSRAAAMGTWASISVQPLRAPSDETIAASAITVPAQPPHMRRAASAKGAEECIRVSRGITPITTAVPRM